MKNLTQKVILSLLICTALSFASTDYTDSIVAAVGAPLATNITHRFVVTGFSIGNPITLYALGRSYNTGLLSSKSVKWSITSGLSKYPAIISAADGRTGPSFTFTPQPDMSSTSDQSDSGNIRLTFTNELSQIKTYNIMFVIIDQTDRTSPNSVAIFNATDYLPNAVDPAALESLFVNKYDVPGLTVTKVPGDTVVELYSLLFSKRAGFAPKYKGLDTVKSWLVRPSVSVPRLYGDISSITYTNHFAPRNDTIDVVSSIDSTRRVFVRWAYGTQRFLNLQARAGSLNDNVSRRISGKDISMLDQKVSSDTVYACVRDEHENFISYIDTIEWRIVNSGYSSYVNFTQSNPCIISKVQNGIQEYTMTAKIPAGKSIIGTGDTLRSALYDTLRISLSASGFDDFRIVLSPGSSYNSMGTIFSEFTSPPTSSILKIRAADTVSGTNFPKFRAYMHRIGTLGMLPSGWEVASQSIKWYYKNYAPFGNRPDTIYYESERVIKPLFHIAGLVDTLIAEFNYDGKTFRDSVCFQTLPAYATIYAISCPDTVIAGDSSAFMITIKDHNSVPVVDTSLIPKRVEMFSSSSVFMFRGQDGWITGLDPDFATNVPVKFQDGVTANLIKSSVSGRISFSVRFILNPGDTVWDAFDIFVKSKNSVENNNSLVPETFELHQNSPNPYNPFTKISYALPEDGNVTLQVFSLSGKLLKTISNRNLKAGFYTEKINANEFGSGLFLYRLKSGKHELTKTMTIMR
ncbi:MAG: T9SS type A sorting domain-containing protein [Fibrobacteres bacterium]|nr:T9SS type A sorting domain-containing protein [Fibrobacterota bacterium]